MFVQNTIDIDTALRKNKTLFIDVRSPLEFKEATIPGAISTPILDDEERAVVGTIYRKINSDEATIKGVEYASEKLPGLFSTIKQYADQYDHVVIFCWRGGTRSKSVCSFLNMLNINNVYQLIGGYKAYRKYIVDYIENNMEKHTFVMVHGLTGVGKTHILDKLDALGLPVINLEEIAKNSGSVFGDIVFEGTPPSQKMFDGELFHALFHTNKNYIFVESESKRIGNVQIPDALYNRMVTGYHVLVKTTLENRVNVILKDYVDHLVTQDEKIKKSISHLRKRLGNKTVDLLLQKVEEQDYNYVIKYLIENYYDPLYKFSIEKYDHYDLVVDYEKMEECIELFVQFWENLWNTKEKETGLDEI